MTTKTEEPYTDAELDELFTDRDLGDAFRGSFETLIVTVRHLQRQLQLERIRADVVETANDELEWRLALVVLAARGDVAGIRRKLVDEGAFW